MNKKVKMLIASLMVAGGAFVASAASVSASAVFVTHGACHANEAGDPDADHSSLAGFGGGMAGVKGVHVSQDGGPLTLCFMLVP